VVALADLGGWPAILGPLLAGNDLSSTAAGAAMADVLAGEASPVRLTAFLVGLRMKGETAEEMAGLVEAMLAASQPVVLPEGLRAVDTCGTGGALTRRRAAFNISTIAALVVAGAGAPVCKHGNRAASSTSGSADLLDALGVAVDLGPTGVARCVAEAGIGFCFAPRFHPAMRHAGPARRELGVPTVLNFLGPLANPARVRHQLVGVSDAAMGEKVLDVLAAQGAEHVLVVFGHDGLDELTTTTTSTVLERRGDASRTWVVDPSELGIPLSDPDDLQGGDPAVNAARCAAILAGERGPQRDVVLLNAAAGLLAASAVDDLPAGYEAAAASVDTGRAAAALESLVATSQEAQAAEAAA
jgi:anthranilate phosphoribosyltransferase